MPSIGVIIKGPEWSEVDDIEQVRPEVRDFAIMMENQLRRHEASKGDSWRRASYAYFTRRLHDEVEEIDEVVQHWILAVHSHPEVEDPIQLVRDVEERIVDEALDVGNFAMFLATQAKKGKLTDEEIMRKRREAENGF